MQGIGTSKHKGKHIGSHKKKKTSFLGEVSDQPQFY